MKKHIIFLIAISLPLQATGSYYLNSRVIDIRLHVIPFGEYEKLGLSMQLSEDSSKLTALTVYIDDDEVRIPVEDVADYKYPIGSSPQILCDPFNMTDMTVYVEFEEFRNTEGDFPVYFHIENKMYINHTTGERR